MTAARGPLALLTAPDYLRLWIAGGVGNAMRWLELLVGGIFAYQVSGSALDVALVTVARNLPMLLAGALVGVVAEALNRKVILVVGFFILAANAATLCVLAAHDVIRIWHVALGGVVAGTVWSTEMSVRRRMIGEVMPGPQIGQAIAFDSLTGAATRMLGPLLGGAAFETIGLGGAFLLSAVLHLGAALFATGLVFRQEARPLRFARLLADIAEGLRIVRAEPILLGVVLVTVVTNVFGFSYQTLIAPLGLHKFAVSPLLVGVLAAAEPFGASAAGLALSAGWLRLDHRRGMIRGSVLFLGALCAASLAPWYAAAFLLLLLGGLGTAAFSVMQSTLILTEAPPALRSRVMGIVTVCIGTGPLGVLALGALAEALGPSAALLLGAGTGLAALALVWLRLTLPARG